MRLVHLIKASKRKTLHATHPNCWTELWEKRSSLQLKVTSFNLNVLTLYKPPTHVFVLSFWDIVYTGCWLGNVDFECRKTSQQICSSEVKTLEGLFLMSLHELHYWQLYKYSTWPVHVWVKCSIKLGILLPRSNLNCNTGLYPATRHALQQHMMLWIILKFADESRQIILCVTPGAIDMFHIYTCIAEVVSFVLLVRNWYNFFIFKGNQALLSPDFQNQMQDSLIGVSEIEKKIEIQLYKYSIASKSPALIMPHIGLLLLLL